MSAEDDAAAFKDQTDALVKKFKGKREQIEPNMRKALTSCALIVEREAKESMRPGDGIAYKRRSVIHIASSPGNPPAVDTGRLRASITHRLEWEAGGAAAYVGTSVEYARHLEFGTSKMEPRPFLRPAVLINRQKIAETIAKGIAAAMKEKEADTGGGE